MVNKIYIEGFKSIYKLEMELKQFTLFAGTNSSGKSLCIQALLLLVQNLENQYGFNGPYVSVGDYREIKNFNVNLKPALLQSYRQAYKIKR